MRRPLPARDPCVWRWQSWPWRTVKLRRESQSLGTRASHRGSRQHRVTAEEQLSLGESGRERGRPALEPSAHFLSAAGQLKRLKHFKMSQTKDVFGQA
jgi:hypothetical protein